MQSFLVLVVTAAVVLLRSCGNGQPKVTNSNLIVVDFADKIKELPTAAISDAR